MTNYAIKRTFGDQAFEVSGPLENATDRNNYFTRNGGTYKLTYAGEKFAQHTALNTEKA